MSKSILKVLLFLSLPTIIYAQVEPKPVTTGTSAVNTKNYLMGKYDYTRDSGFAQVPMRYTKGRKQYLRNEALKHFLEMAEAARKDSVNLFIIAATRNFNEQMQIWDDKWIGKTLVNGKNLSEIKDTMVRAKEIMKITAMPGASRHHWGTDVDLDSSNNIFFNQGEGLKVYDWLMKNAHKYGFCNPYDKKGNKRKTGYEEERWHWSYYPIADVCMDRYFHEIKYEDITGFPGAGTDKEIGLIKNYLESENTDCK